MHHTALITLHTYGTDVMWCDVVWCDMIWDNVMDFRIIYIHTLHYIALHCIALQYITLHYIHTYLHPYIDVTFMHVAVYMWTAHRNKLYIYIYTLYNNSWEYMGICALKGWLAIGTYGTTPGSGNPELFGGQSPVPLVNIQIAQCQLIC